MHNVIEEEIKNLEHKIEIVKGFEQAAVDAQLIVDKLGKGYLACYTPNLTNVPGVCINLDVNNLKETESFMKELSRLNYKISERNDFPEIQRAKWRFDKDEHYIHLLVFLVGETCKFVKVGTIEKPVYELQCE